MVSTVTRCQPHRAPLWYGDGGHCDHECAAAKSTATVRCCQYGRYGLRGLGMRDFCCICVVCSMYRMFSSDCGVKLWTLTHIAWDDNTVVAFGVKTCFWKNLNLWHSPKHPKQHLVQRQITVQIFVELLASSGKPTTGKSLLNWMCLFWSAFNPQRLCQLSPHSIVLF